MDWSNKDISAVPDVEYEVEVFLDGIHPSIVRCGLQFLRTLVQKYNSQIMVRQYGKTSEDDWHPARYFGLFKQKQKSVAVAEARLRNSFPI